MTGIERLSVTCLVLGFVLFGWGVGDYIGAGAALIVAVLLLVIPWRGQQLWMWGLHFLRRNRPFAFVEPVTVANDRAGGGVRYQDGIAVAAVQITGKRHSPTFFVGSTATQTANTLDLAALLPMMRQSLGLTLDSLSVVMAGSRRRTAGDYPRIYDTLIGTPPYAGQRETWLILRIRAAANGDAMQWRTTLGAAALAAAQRVTARLRQRGVRARVASSADIVELERRTGRGALEPHNRRWHSIRSDTGWLTTYSYEPDAIRADILGQAWCLPADGIVQNVTLFPDATATATVTVRTAQPPTAPPSVAFGTLPGEQTQAVASGMCAPLPRVRGLRRGKLPDTVVVPVGPSGVLIGKVSAGDRMSVPLADPVESSRVHIAADDRIAKRLVIRAAGAGERITLHTKDFDRWASVRMANVAVTDQPRPVAGTTLSVVDGSVPPAPRPHTVISVGPPSSTYPTADILIEQTGPAAVCVHAGGAMQAAEIELFRAENRFVDAVPTDSRAK